jgi:hypothetical protein
MLKGELNFDTINFREMARTFIRYFIPLLNGPTNEKNRFQTLFIMILNCSTILKLHFVNVLSPLGLIFEELLMFFQFYFFSQKTSNSKLNMD